MGTKQENSLNLPIQGKLPIIYAASLLIATLMTAASFAGLRHASTIYPTEELVQAFLPNDVVNFFIGLPILLGSMWLAWRGRLVGLLCWMGALFFILYNYTAYVFAMPMSWAFLVHLSLVMLSVYTLIGLVANVDRKAVQEGLTGSVPEKFAGGVLAGLGLLFFLRAIGVLVSSFNRGGSLAETELAVNIADFLITPAWIIGGILLWRHKQFGYVTGLGLLFQGSMLFIALIVFLLLQPLLTTAPFALTDVMVIFVMGIIFFIPFVLFLRGAAAGTHTSTE
jgi:hypothetical protein